MKRVTRAALLAAACCGLAGAGKKESRPAESPLDRYVREAGAGSSAQSTGSPGSIWSSNARLADGARDPRAALVDDVVTVMVVERASALAKGTVKSSRASSTKNSITALTGLTRAAGPLVNLAGVSGDTQLTGEGATSRETALSTTMTARVTRVLPNGAMLVEGSKDVQVNAEWQVVTVRGVVRPPDIGPGNVVSSDRLADLEIKVNGKGVVGDAIRRPFILYRILLGLLPF